MPIEIKPINKEDLPFEPESSDCENSIAIQSRLDEDEIADGETKPYPWMDLRYMPEHFSRLIDAGEVVLEARGGDLGFDLSA